MSRHSSLPTYWLGVYGSPEEKEGHKKEGVTDRGMADGRFESSVSFTPDLKDQLVLR